MNTTRTSILIASLFFMLGASAAVSVEVTSKDPSKVQSGERTVQNITLLVHEISADGRADKLYVSFPDDVGIDPRKAESNVSHSLTELPVDRNGDGRRESLEVRLNPEGGGTTTAEVSLSILVFYKTEDMPLQTIIEDSSGTSSNITETMEVESPGSKINNPDNSDDESEKSKGLIAQIISFLTGIF